MNGWPLNSIICCIATVANGRVCDGADDEA